MCWPAPGAISSCAVAGAPGGDDTARGGLAVDGEGGFSLRLGGSGLTLRKGTRHVSMPYAKIASAAWERRYRYSRTMRNIGFALLPVLGVGAVLLALYYLTAHDALVLSYGGREYQLSGERALLERGRSRIRSNRAGADDSSE